MSSTLYRWIWIFINFIAMSLIYFLGNYQPSVVMVSFIVGNILGFIQEYIGNDLKILNQDHK